MFLLAAEMTRVYMSFLGIHSPINKKNTFLFRCSRSRTLLSLKHLSFTETITETTQHSLYVTKNIIHIIMSRRV